MPGILDALFSGNPFQRATGGDPWQGLREVGPSAAQPVAQPQAQPTSQMSMSNPMSKAQTYSSMRDPNGPLARAGWIGSLMATGPTRQEVLLEQAGAGQQAAVQGIGQRIAAGMPPQRAMLDFVNSEEGQEFFVSGGGFSDLANIVKGVSPAPLPDPINMGAGSSIFQPDGAGGGSMIANNPVGEVQKFQAMTDFANMTKAEIEETARAQMAAELGGDPTEGEAAVGRLVQSGRMSRETGDLMLSGAYKVQPILDQSGATVGHALVDISTGTMTQLPNNNSDPNKMPQPGDANHAAGVTPGTSEHDLEQMDNQPTFQGMTNPADVVDSAGPVGFLMEKLGPIAGNLFPALSPVETTRNRKILGSIMADANMLAKNGKVLATEMNDLRSLADTLKVFTDPQSATQTLLSLHDRYDNHEKELLEMEADPKTTAAVRGDAALDLAAIRRAKANLPSRESLTAKAAVLKSKKPMDTIGEQINEGNKALKQSGIIEGDKPAATEIPGSSYSDLNTLRSDWESGKLTKGMTVTLNGKKYPITRNFKE